MSHEGFPVRWPDRSGRLRALVDEALVERRQRLSALDATMADVDDADGLRRHRAAHLVERMLSSRKPARADCSRFLELLAGRLQMASPVIGQLMTSIVPLVMPSRRARALAVMIADVFAFAEASAVRDRELRVYLALGFDEDQLVVGVGTEGAIAPVGTANATLGLLRARAIAELMGGRLDRGIDRDRMVVGITLPAQVADGFRR